MTPTETKELKLKTFAQHLEYLHSLPPSQGRTDLIHFINERAEKYTKGNLHCLDIRLTKEKWEAFNEFEKKYNGN